MTDLLELGQRDKRPTPTAPRRRGPCGTPRSELDKDQLGKKYVA